MTANDRKQLEAIIESYRNDPILYCSKVLHLEPTAQQREFLEALAKPGARVAVRSGHGTGKSTALAAAGLWFVSTHKDALVPCTAPTAHQLQDVLWREYRRLIGRMNDWWKEQFTVNSDRITLKGSTGMIVARTARPENPDALQGFHAPNILFEIDEAAGVADAIFEVARGALSTPSARVAQAANPTRLTGYFHNAFHLARDSWTRLQFSCLDSPLVDPSYARDIAAEYGEDSDMYRIRVLGDFPKHGLLSIISAERVDLALERSLHPHAVDYAPAVLGVDPAWEGSDRSVIVLRKGIFAKVLLVRRGLLGDALAAHVARFQDSERADYTFVDKTGVGASCCDFLRSNGRQYSGISFASGPTEERFMNRRAEIWWQMREWFEQDVALAPHPDIKADLIGPEYGIKDNGKIYLESKESMRERGLASPDLGDALALTFALPVAGKSAPAVVKNAASKNYRPFGILQRKA